MTHVSIVTGFCILGAAVGLAQETSGPVIKTETRLVLVDAVVTKKGEYVRDLSQKDFKIYEDNHEQTITSFAFEADPKSPANSQPRYLVLFFDNSTMDLAHQKYARDAAAKFVEANAGPKRMMAIVEYGASLRITQNFTDDGDRLKKIVSGVKLAPGTPGSGGLAVEGLSRAAGSYNTRTSILALKSLVKNLTGVPGRKSLILFSGGFKLDQEMMSEVTLLVDACNKANVAVYPIDARGLVASNDSLDQWKLLAYGGIRVPGMSFLFQAKPGTGPGGGGGGPRPTAPTTPSPRPPSTTPSPAPSRPSGGTVNPTQQMRTQPQMPPRAIIMPPITPNASDNQQPMYMLANGTGGFVIVNTNDMLGGLEKIGKEQNEHYMIGYSPENFEEGKCHTLKVKVTQSGMTVRARTGYCDVKPADLLSGNPVEKDLEKLLTDSSAGTVKASMQAPYFYTAVNTARMNVAVDMPSDIVKFEKHKGKFHGQVNILGMVYRPDGGVAAKFSDTMKFDFDDKKAMTEWLQRPTLHYEKDVEGVPGKYTLKMAVSSGANSFAKLELPVSIDPYDGAKLSLSSLAFSTVMRQISKTDVGLDTAMSEDRTPLIVGGIQLFPSARTVFKSTEAVALYAELYAPALNAAEIPKDFAAAIQMRLIEIKTGKVKIDTGAMRAGELHAGNPVVPVAMKIPVDQLGPGQYTCELLGADVLGGQGKRVANFTVE